MAAKVKLSEIIDAIEMMMDECTPRLDTKTGQVCYVTNDVMRDVEEGDLAELLKDCAEWQRGEYEIADAMLREPERFLDLPDKHEVDEYGMMREFAETWKDERVGNELLRAISGRGAFRYFKDTVHRYGIEKSWYAFRADQFRRVAVEWCKGNGLEWEEGSPRNGVGGVRDPGFRVNE